MQNDDNNMKSFGIERCISRPERSKFCILQVSSWPKKVLESEIGYYGFRKKSRCEPMQMGPSTCWARMNAAQHHRENNHNGPKREPDVCIERAFQGPGEVYLRLLSLSKSHFSIEHQQTEFRPQTNWSLVIQGKQKLKRNILAIDNSQLQARDDWKGVQAVFA